MNQPGRDAPSRPDTSVRALVSVTVQSGALPPSDGHPQVHDLPSIWRNAIASPLGDHTGAHDRRRW